ncbi:MAG: hypothetical protein V4547_04855 [Bacteroidota bacterium]
MVIIHGFANFEHPDNDLNFGQPEPVEDYGEANWASKNDFELKILWQIEMLR